MARFKLTRNSGSEDKDLFQVKLPKSLIADINFMVTWARRDRTDVVAEMLWYALAQESDFQSSSGRIRLARPMAQDLIRMARRSRPVSVPLPRLPLSARWPFMSPIQQPTFRAYARDTLQIVVESRLAICIMVALGAGWVINSYIPFPEGNPFLGYIGAQKPTIFEGLRVSYTLFLFSTPFILASAIASFAYVHLYEPSEVAHEGELPL